MFPELQAQRPHRFRLVLIIIQQAQISARIGLCQGWIKMNTWVCDDDVFGPRMPLCQPCSGHNQLPALERTGMGSS